MTDNREGGPPPSYSRDERSAQSRQQSQTDIRGIAETVARVTVRATFMAVGVDIEDSDSMRSFMSDMLFIRQQRERNNQSKAQLFAVFAASACAAILSVLGVLVVSYLHGVKP